MYVQVSLAPDRLCHYEPHLASIEQRVNMSNPHAVPTLFIGVNMAVL